MKRFLLLALTAGLFSQIDAEAEGEFAALEPPNPHTYQKSSVVRWEIEGKRHIGFKGTTRLPVPLASSQGAAVLEKTWKRNKTVLINKDNRYVFDYRINCENNHFDRKGDVLRWINSRHDYTAESVASKYCPLDSWNQLPIDPTK